MTMMTILKRADFPIAPLKAAGQRLGADTGDPQSKVLQVAENAAGRLGIWECTPGGWPVVDRQDTEVAVILSGVADITDDATSTTVTIRAGDVLILPPGWTGRWDVRETVRKFYAIY